MRWREGEFGRIHGEGEIQRERARLVTLRNELEEIKLSICGMESSNKFANRSLFNFS